MGFMKYDDWVRGKLAQLSQTLGFLYTPRQELEDRLSRLKVGMDKEGMEGFLVIEKMNRYYLSGTTQDGYLFVPLTGRPLLMTKRELERARIESPLRDVVPIRSVSEIPSLIQDHQGRLPKALGLELRRVDER